MIFPYVNQHEMNVTVCDSKVTSKGAGDKVNQESDTLKATNKDQALNVRLNDGGPPRN